MCLVVFAVSQSLIHRHLLTPSGIDSLWEESDGNILRCPLSSAAPWSGRWGHPAAWLGTGHADDALDPE